MITDTQKLRFLRQRFDEYVRNGDAAEADDIDFVAWAALKEFRSDAEIGEMQSNTDTIKYELAFHLWCAAFLAKGLSVGQSEVLLSMVRAFVDPTSRHQLVISRNKRGRAVSAFHDAISFEQARRFVQWLEREVASGTKLESAIADAKSRFGFSRSKAMELWSLRETFAKANETADIVMSLEQENEKD
jgi:hypothetical protein